MAYKDEYEVARLYTDGRFEKTLRETFKGGSLKVWLSPPVIHATGPDGRPTKSQFGEWMLRLAFPAMAKLKGLRGGPLDLFGKTAHRRLERTLMTDFETDLDRIIAELTPERLTTAREIAALPQDIRGYGYIKEEAAASAAVEREQLWAQWEGGVKPPTQHSLDLSRVRSTTSA
jgi:indolepyruvate ferredoxin oxidoreductase